MKIWEATNPAKSFSVIGVFNVKFYEVNISLRALDGLFISEIMSHAIAKVCLNFIALIMFIWNILKYIYHDITIFYFF